MVDGVRVQNAVPWSRPLPKRLLDQKKALCIPPPVFLCPAFIHYDARLVEGGSPHPVPFASLKLSNEIPKHFLTNGIFFFFCSEGGPKTLFDLLIRVFTDKKTSGMSELSFMFNFLLQLQD